MILAAATGAVIGVVVVIALSWSLSVLGERRRAGLPGDPNTLLAHRTFRLHWTMKAAIIALSVGAYGYLGYINRSAPPADIAPPQNQQAAFAPPTQPATFTVGGVVLSYAPPAGYCLYPAPLLQAIVAQQEKLNPDNVVHTVFGNCDQLRDATVNQARIHDFGMLMTPKAQLGQDFDKPALDRIIASAVDPKTVKETLDQRLRDAQSRLKLQSVSSLGILDRDKNAAYFGYLFKADAQGESFAQACIMAMTATKGRLVTYYLYSDYSKDARTALLTLLQKVKASLDDLAAQNS